MWRKEYEEFGQGSFPGNGKLKQTPEQERIAELERKLKDAELERDILHLSKTVDDLCFH
jgi:transposase